MEQYRADLSLTEIEETKQTNVNVKQTKPTKITRSMSCESLTITGVKEAKNETAQSNKK